MLALIAIGAGAVAGLARGGRLEGLADLGVRHLWLPAVGVGALAVLRFGDGDDAPAVVRVGVLVVSYGAMAAVVAVNRQVRALYWVAAGAGLNVLAIALNGGMPVSAAAARAAGLGNLSDSSDLLWGKHVVAGPDTRLSLLGDVLPVPVAGFRQVLSAGDLLVLVGIAVLVASAVGRARRAADAPSRGR